MLIALRNKGDTIVEVLMAIAVVSAVLGGAYVASTRSLGGTRQSQERGEAVRLVEAQLERLKQAAKTDPTVFTDATNPFCFDETAAAMTRYNAGNVACRQGVDDRYQIQVQRTLSGSFYMFAASAQWERAGGGGTDNVRIVYRAYQ